MHSSLITHLLLFPKVTNGGRSPAAQKGHDTVYAAYGCDADEEGHGRLAD